MAKEALDGFIEDANVKPEQFRIFYFNILKMFFFFQNNSHGEAEADVDVAVDLRYEYLDDDYAQWHVENFQTRRRHQGFVI